MTLHIEKRAWQNGDELERFRVAVSTIVEDIMSRDGYELEVGVDEHVFLRLRVWRLDAVTHVMGWGYSGKAFLNPAQSTSDIVRVAFGLFKGYAEHEEREFFKYKGVAVFGPHQDVEALVEISRRIDIKPMLGPPPGRAKFTFESEPWWRRADVPRVLPHGWEQDPNTEWEECPNCVTPWTCNGPHVTSCGDWPAPCNQDNCPVHDTSGRR